MSGLTRRERRIRRRARQRGHGTVTVDIGIDTDWFQWSLEMALYRISPAIGRLSRAMGKVAESATATREAFDAIPAPPSRSRQLLHNGRKP